jgi:hypothetical protein
MPAARSPDGTRVVELYDAAVYDDSQIATTSYAPPINPSPYDTPADVVNATLVTSTTPWSIYWDPPAAISTSLYGAGFWTGANVNLFDASKVNDGNTAVKAFDVNVAADSTITFDAGVGVTKEMRWLLMYGNWATVVEYSDNGAVWTPVTNFRSNTRPVVASATRLGWDPPGAHRFWRARKGSSTAVAIDCFEMQWGEGGAVNPYIENYILYVYPIGGPRGAAVNTISAKAIPTVTNPLALFPPLASLVTSSNGTVSTGAIGVDIVAVTNGSIPSAGVQVNLVTFGAAAQTALPYVPTAGNSFAATNGVNSNIAIDANADVIVITGPTLAFSITGIAGGRDGQIVTFMYDGTQAMTITNLATSAAANQIDTLTAANIVMAPGKSQFTVKYSATLNHWRIQAARDSTGPK